WRLAWAVRDCCRTVPVLTYVLGMSAPQQVRRRHHADQRPGECLHQLPQQIRASRRRVVACDSGKVHVRAYVRVALSAVEPAEFTSLCALTVPVCEIVIWRDD